VQEADWRILVNLGSRVHCRIRSQKLVVKEILGVQQLLEEIGLKVQSPLPLKVDNAEAIRQIGQESSSQKLKHVDMRYKFLCVEAKRQRIVPSYIKSEDQAADMFTKPMPQQKLIKLRMLSGLSA